MSGVTDRVSLAEVADDWNITASPAERTARSSTGPPTGAVWESADADPANIPDAVPQPATPRVPARAAKASPTEDEYKKSVSSQDAYEWAGF